MVAGRRTDDPFGHLLWGQPCHLVVRPPQLEGEHLTTKVMSNMRSNIS